MLTHLSNSAKCEKAIGCILMTLVFWFLPLIGMAKSTKSADPPNIIFVILDDVGVDLMQLYGHGGANPPSTPSIDSIAAQGVKFTNVWSLPECSPTRSAFFTGRFGLRTGVTTAIIENMLPQAQVSPYETTLPRLLRTAGYTSAMLGKYHLGSANPSGNCSPATRGFDFFDGNMEAGPPSIDTQAGSVENPGTQFSCGFVRGNDLSAVFGACYFEDSSCQENMTGKTCMQEGGLLDANAMCQAQKPDYLDFDRNNGYYAWPDSVTVGSLPAPSSCTASGIGCAGLTCPTNPDDEPEKSRQYISDAQTVGAVDWWQQQTGPRMLTVSYNSIHTPFQPPPTTSDVDPVDALICQGDNASRDDNLALSKAMLENVDQQIAQLLANLGLATLDDQGSVAELHLDRMNTMLVIIGDNGTFGPVVRLPFDPTRAKGSVYQTGVSVPMVVAGPLIEGVGRDVSAMVSAVDLFELFNEFAGLDPREIVPPAHRLDSQPMLHHLLAEESQAGRPFNYTEVSGADTLPKPIDPKSRFWPCVLLGDVVSNGRNTTISGGICVDLLFENKSFCEDDNNGDWFGPETAWPNPYATLPAEPDGAWGSCCAVHDSLSNPQNVMRIGPVSQRAAQIGPYKLVELDLANCEQPDPEAYPAFETITASQLYDLDVIPIDYLQAEICSSLDSQKPPSEQCGDGISSAALPNGNVCANAPQCLRTTPVLSRAFSELQSRINGMVNSVLSCPGDGNLDKRVTEADVQGVLNFMGTGPSYFDLNKDGLTDVTDLTIAQDNLGLDCLSSCRRADIDGDNRVTRNDASILRSSFGRCDSDLAADNYLCAGDLNGDGQIDRKDLRQLRLTKKENNGLACAITVVGQDDASGDAEAIQTAIDTASLDPNGGRVILQGVFDMGGCSFCNTIHGPVIIEGKADPATGRRAQIRNAGASPFVISDQSSGGGEIHIEGLWFNGGISTALSVTQLRGRLELVDNRVSGFSAVSIDGTPFRFGFVVAGQTPGGGELSGEFYASGNHIDNLDVPFEVGDDNGIALQGCEFSRIDIVDNLIHTRGESIEIENCTNPTAIINIKNNDISTDAAISPLAPLGQAVGLDESGGHPAAIKVAGGRASKLLIQNNRVVLSGASTAVCMMLGLNNPDADILIRRNHCSLNGQFAALLGGYIGNLPFFPPFYLQNATISNNSFEGNSYLGIGLVDFVFAGPVANDANSLINAGNRNKFFGNNFSALNASHAAVFFGANTSGNTFRGNAHGVVEDLGANNSITGSKR